MPVPATSNPRTAAAVVVAACAALAAAGCGGSESMSGTAPATHVSPFAGAEISNPHAAPDFALRDQDGKLVRLSEQRGRTVLVTFLYTRCPDVCPLIATNLNSALRELGSNARDARVLAVSVDPRGDTAARVDDYVRAHRLLPEFRYLTGTTPELAKVWRAYDILAVARDPEQVDHSTYTLLIDERGRGRVVYDATVKAKDVAHDIRALTS